MRYLIVLSLLLVGCGPKFKAGDCLADNTSRDPWETGWSSEKVVAVGKHSYLLDSVGPYTGHILRNSYPISLEDRIATKVKCPKELE